MDTDDLPDHSPECRVENRAEGWYPPGCPRCEEAQRRECEFVTRAVPESAESERWTEVYVDLKQTVKATVCLECGLLVGVETLHEGRCFGEKVTDHGRQMARMEWEARVEAGDYDDE